MAMQTPAKGKVDSFFDNVKNQLGSIVLVVLVPWVILGLDLVAHFFGGDFREWFALRPRQWIGLHGIFTMPLVHADFWHLVYNTWGLIIALTLVVVLRPQTWRQVLLAVYLLSGLLTWVFGTGKIVGASGVVLGLVCFLVAPAVLLLGWWGWNTLRKQRQPCPIQVHPIPLVLSFLIGLFYLQNLFFNLVPIPGLNTGSHTSWTAHWCGAIAGLAVAFAFYRLEDTSVLTEKSLVEESFL